MPEMKFERMETLSRMEAAARLSAIAEALGSDDKFELERGGEKLELSVPDQVRFELEVEIKDDETELEVEIKWSTATEEPA
jgi:amphi-Trp domain-containing protein